jgi:hypothetical protein
LKLSHSEHNCADARIAVAQTSLFNTRLRSPTNAIRCVMTPHLVGRSWRQRSGGTSGLLVKNWHNQCDLRRIDVRRLRFQILEKFGVGIGRNKLKEAKNCKFAEDRGSIAP